jgi:hypothetical protein
MNPANPVVIPEFPSWTILPLFMVVTLFAVIVYNELEENEMPVYKEKGSKTQLIPLIC